MQRHATIVALALGLCATSCQAEPEPESEPAISRGGCDLEALERAAATVGSTRGYARATSAWTGIEAACRPALPEVVGMYFDDLIEAGPPRDWAVHADELTRFETRVCPQWAHVARELEAAPLETHAKIVYDRCNMERFDVLAYRELGTRSPGVMSWGVHALMLEQGLPRYSARTLTRALYTLEQLGRPPVERVPELRWPQAEGVEMEPGMSMFVYLSRSELRVGDWSVGLDALLDDGDVRGDLEVRLARMRQISRADPAKTLVVVADADTPQRVLRVVLESASRIGIEELGLFLDPLTDAWIYMPLPPLVASSPAPEQPRARYDELAHARALARLLTVEYGPQSYTLMRGDRPEAEPVVHPRDEPLHDAITSLSANGRVQIVIGVGDEVTAGALIELLETLSGRNVKLTGERAHGFDPEFARSLHDIATAQREIEPSRGPEDSLPRNPLPTVIFGAVEAEGPFDADFVRRVGVAHRIDLRRCYSLGAVDDPELAGELRFAFTIRASGEVTAVEVSSKTSSDEVNDCLTKAVQRWKFPAGDDGRETRVLFPIVLDPRLGR